MEFIKKVIEDIFKERKTFKAKSESKDFITISEGNKKLVPKQ